jgi:arylsulfatase A
VKHIPFCGFVTLAILSQAVAVIAAAPRPNIIVILADDLGYGDVRCLGHARSKIATPAIDRFAAGGMIFTEAHSGSSVCTPTRYGILTGRYAWRTRLQRGVLHGYSSPLIAADRLTVPALLRQHGYETACLGKWHLGMGISRSPHDLQVQQGPTTRGFDHFFGVSASLDMPPFTFIRDDRITVAPTATKTFLRKGPAAPDFEAVDVLPTLTRKAIEYLQQHTRAKSPFFLYLALTSPHTPIVPTKEWQGRSGLNKYGDFVMQTDHSIGEMLNALDECGLADSTLVVFTSDNGCSPAAGIPELEGKDHFPSELRRGYKADIWDGGHRIPLVARWPGKIAPGSHSNQLACLTDLMATCAELLGTKLPANAGEDSVSILPALRGTASAPLREAVVHHSIEGKFAIRRGKWKLELCADSGGWSKGRVQDAPGQLYDMTQDIGERANQFRQHPEIVAALTKLLQKYVAEGRSTPGAPQHNDKPVDLWKQKKTQDADVAEVE